jgi:hypothetical protein
MTKHFLHNKTTFSKPVQESAEERASTLPSTHDRLGARFLLYKKDSLCNTVTIGGQATEVL